MVYFSRASYTEPTALAGVFIGLTFLIAAFKTGTRHHYFIAGLSVGIAALARADGILAVDGALFAIAVVLTLAREPAQRRVLRRGLIGFAGGGAITSAAGMVDLAVNSPNYYPFVKHDMELLFGLLIAILVAGLVLSTLPVQRIRQAAGTHRSVIAKAAGGLIAGVCVVMASRPLWWTGRFNTGSVGQQAVANLQQAQGVPVAATRSYDEHTVNWLAWYLGWPTVCIAAAGLTVLAVGIVRRRERAALGLLGPVGLVSIFYLNDISITPDQIWASRRLLPVIIPGVLLAAGYALYRLGRRARWRWLALALAVLMAILPGLQWRGLFTAADYDGELRVVNSMCTSISTVSHGQPGHTVLVRTLPAIGYYAAPIKIVCGSDVVQLQTATAPQLAQVQRNWGNVPITVITFNSTAVPWTRTPRQPQYRGVVSVWEQPLNRRPYGVTTMEQEIFVGALQPSGLVSPAVVTGLANPFA
jgi:hypothetical protein